MRMLVWAAAVALNVGAAQAQQWEQYRETPQADSPIRSHLIGWEDGSWRYKTGMNKGITGGTGAGELFLYDASIRKGSYWGGVLFRETIMGREWTENSIRAFVERRPIFKDATIAFQNNGSVSNGPAEYRYLMFTADKNGEKNVCIGFNAFWRTYMSEGYVCSPKTPVTEASGQAFIKALDYKNMLAPVGGSMPE